ncbi:MAG: hypothetical protein KDJ52_27275 [Anaerolineae bacterium]|nr:hypothetical protein [Anaerolineae bacterium]
MIYVFVLWSEGFDEKIASIFVTILRDAGLLVKVVGLTMHNTGGAHGLVLVPDLTLDQALPLAPSTLCMIIPSLSRWSNRLNNDPRVQKFIEQAHFNQAIFVVGQQAAISSMKLQQSSLHKENIIVFPEDEYIITFARKLARLLSKKITQKQ